MPGSIQPGMFHLLLGQPYDSLLCIRRQSRWHGGSDDRTSLRRLDRLSFIRKMIPGYDWALRLLRLARQSNSRIRPPWNRSGIWQLREPRSYPAVVILAGGTSGEIQSEITSRSVGGIPRISRNDHFRRYDCRDLRLVGKVQAAYPEAIATIGYIRHTFWQERKSIALP